MPAAANLRSSHDSRKKPLLSPNTRGLMRITSGISVGRNSMRGDSGVTADDLEQIRAVTALLQRPGQLLELGDVDEAAAISDLFGAGHLQSLSRLQCLDEHRRLQK